MGDAGRLQRKYPDYFLEVGRQVEIDISRLVQARSIYSRAIIDGGSFQAFIGTYRGNVAQFFLQNLTNEMAAALSRLFAPINDRRPESESDRSLRLAVHALKNDEKIIRIFRRSARRWGASGEYTFTDQDGVRELKFTETLRLRIQNAKEQERHAMIELYDAIEKVEEFSTSEDYGRVRTYRTERLSHSLRISSDRRNYFIPEDYTLTYGHLMDAVDKGIEVASEAYGAFFGTELGLDDLSRIWDQYAHEFWSAAAELVLPKLDFSGALRNLARS